MPSQKLDLLDDKRRFQISLGRQKLTMELDQLIDIINRLDIKALSFDSVQILKNLLPGEYEKKKLLNYADDVNKLKSEELWMVRFCGIPRCEAKVRSMFFMKDFENQMSTLEPEVDTIAKATSALMESQWFGSLVDAGLVLVNRCNNGKPRMPFLTILTVDDLLKLSLTKSNGSGQSKTMLEYLIVWLKESAGLSKDESLKSLVNEAAKLSINTITCNVEALKNEMNLVQKELQRRCEAKESPAGLPQFVAGAEKRVVDLLKASKEAEERFSDCLKYFGEVKNVKKDTESETKMDTHEYFSKLVRFIQTYEEAEKEILTRRNQSAISPKKPNGRSK